MCLPANKTRRNVRRHHFAIFDENNGCRQQSLTAAESRGEMLIGGKQCGVSAKTESRRREQKRKSRSRATPQGHLIYNKGPTAAQLLQGSGQSACMPGDPPHTTHSNHFQVNYRPKCEKESNKASRKSS